MAQETGESTGAQSITPPIEVLLASPICWKPTKIRKFLIESQDCITILPPADLQNFKKQLDDRAVSAECGLWPENGDWEIVVGDEHFKLFTEFKKNRELATRNVDTKSVVELLRVLKNKYNHRNEFSNDKKKKLGWWETNGKKMEFSDRLFVNYWNTKFPNLLLFLWDSFYCYRDKLAEYYLSTLSEYTGSRFFDKSFFQEFLHKACQHQLDKGMMYSRYCSDSSSSKVTLEFQTLPKQLVDWLIFGLDCMEIEMHDTTIDVTWGGQKGIKKTMEIQSGFSTESLSCFIVDIYTGTDMNFDPIQVNLIRSVSNLLSNKKILVFTSGTDEFAKTKAAKDLVDNVNKILPKEREFTREHITFNDLSNESKKAFNSFKVELQSKEYNIADLMPDDCGKNLFKNHLLNTVLAKKHLEIFSDLKLAPVPPAYITRYIEKLYILHMNFLLLIPNDHVCVIVNLNDNNRMSLIHTYFHMPKFNLKVMEKVSDLKTVQFSKEKKNIFIVKNDVSDDVVIRNTVKFVVAAGNEKVVLMRLLENGRLRLLATNIGNPYETFEELYIRYPTELERFRYTEHSVSICDDENEYEAVIFIANMAGMGKSWLLKSIGNIISESVANRVVMHFEMSQLVNSILRRADSVSKLTLSNIVAGMSDILSPRNDLEKKLLDYWFLYMIPIKVRFEIMLDGLDEVSGEFQDFAFEIIKALRDLKPLIRVWVSVRDYLLPKVNEDFGCFACKLVPFNKKEQKAALVKHWSHFSTVNKYNIDEEYLRNCAKFCLKNYFLPQTSNIVGTPLQCQMLAEVFETSLVEKKVIEAQLSLNKLYELFVNRKFEIFLRCKLELQSKNPAKLAKVENDWESILERIHTYLAIKLISGDKRADRFKTHLIQKNILETVLDIGIIHKLYPLKFFHHTIAEYFIAKFLYNVLNHNDLYSNIPQEDIENFVCGYVFQEPICQDNRFRNIYHYFSAMWRESTTERYEECRGLIEFAQHFQSIPGEKEKPIMYLVLQPFENSFTVKRTRYYNLISSHVLLKTSSKYKYACMAMHLDDCNLKEYKKMVENDQDFGCKYWQYLPQCNYSRYGVLHLIIKGVSFNNGIETTLSTLHEVESFIRTVVRIDSKQLEKVDREGNTPLLLLLYYYNFFFRIEHISKFLLKLVCIFVTDFKADVCVTNYKNNTLLHRKKVHHDEKDKAAVHCYIVLLKYFMERGCTTDTINQINNDGDTPLMNVIKHFGSKVLSKDFLQAFHKYGAKFNACSENGTALHVAIKNGCSLSFIKEIVRLGADISAVNKNGQTALHMAAVMLRPKVAKWLVEEKKADVTTKDNFGKTVFD